MQIIFKVINVCGILINQCCVRRCGGCFNQGSKLKFGSFTIGLDLDTTNNTNTTTTESEPNSYCPVNTVVGLNSQNGAVECSAVTK